MCKSADGRLEDFLLAREELETSFNRVKDQEINCGFGQLGCAVVSSGV